MGGGMGGGMDTYILLGGEVWILIYYIIVREAEKEH